MIESVTVKYDTRTPEHQLEYDPGSYYPVTILYRDIIAIAYGTVQYGGQSYDDPRFRLSQISEAEFWQINDKRGMMFQQITSRQEVPQEVLDAITIFKDNFS